MALYRGTVKYTPDGKIKNHYLTNARKPRCSDPSVHEVTDNWFYDTFGIKARSQTIFCSPCAGHAKEYQEKGGSLLKIELLNNLGYSIIFSENVYDFLEVTEHIKDTSNSEEIIQWLEKQSYKKVYSIEEIPQDFRGEVMLYCEEYEVKNI